MKPEEDPSTPSLEWRAMSPQWELLADTFQGSEAIRQGAQAYLPPHAREPAEAHAERVDGAISYPFVRQTTEELVGRAFGKPPSFTGAPDGSEWPDFLANIDFRRRDASNFLRRFFGKGVLLGAAWLLIELRDGRPVWSLLDPRDVFFVSTDATGDLAEVRYRRVVTERDGFAEIDVEEIVRLTPERVEVYRKERDQWALYSADDNAFGKVPLVAFMPERDSVIACSPPLLDLAELQIAHARQLSDLSTILKVASFPVLAMKSTDAGFNDGAEITIGPHSIVPVDIEGDAFYIEHSGAAIERLQSALKALEEKAAEFTGKFAKRRPSVETATARLLDAGEASAPLQSWVLAFVEAVNDALALTAEVWKQAERPTFAMSTDFLSPEGDAASLIRLRELGEVSREGMLTELKRRGVLSQGFDIPADADRLAGEEPLFRTKPADGHAH